MPVTIHTLSPTEFLDHCPQLVDVYITAMDYHPKVRAVRNTAWRNAVMFPELRAVDALDGSRIVGVAYGHLGRAQQWWHSQIRQAVRNSDPRSVALNDYFEVAEVHVLPDYQGRGVGRALLTELLAGVDSPYAILSTPEVAGENNRAFGLYRSFGFMDILRNFLFRGDERPFAVLYLRLEKSTTEKSPKY